MIPHKNKNNNNEEKLNNMPSANGTGGTEKAQAYATIIYPESAPDEWKQILEDTHVRALISPLHDRDKLPDQTLKKEHYHIMLIFDRASSRKRAQKIFESIGGVGCEPILSIVGYARYLTHQDDPDKAQYDAKDVIALSGADYDSILALPDDKWKTLSEIVHYIFEHHITSYSELVKVCADNNPGWFRVVMGRNAYAINSILRSYAWDASSMQHFSEGNKDSSKDSNKDNKNTLEEKSDD